MRLRHRRLAEIAGRIGLVLDEEGAKELIAGSWDLHVAGWRKGEIVGARGAAKWIAMKLEELDSAPLEDANKFALELAAAIEDATQEVGTRAVEGAAVALDALRKEGIATALICDTGFTPARHVRRFLSGHGLELDHYFFSEEVGTPKPFAPIFEAALKAMDAKPALSVHIGDLRRTDIAGARAAGMATIRFAGVHDDGWATEDSQGEEADAVIRHWPELHPLLGLSST